MCTRGACAPQNFRCQHWIQLLRDSGYLRPSTICYDRCADRIDFCLLLFYPFVHSRKRCFQLLYLLLLFEKRIVLSKEFIQATSRSPFVVNALGLPIRIPCYQS